MGGRTSSPGRSPRRTPFLPRSRLARRSALGAHAIAHPFNDQVKASGLRFVATQPERLRQQWPWARLTDQAHRLVSAGSSGGTEGGITIAGERRAVRADPSAHSSSTPFVFVRPLWSRGGASKPSISRIHLTASTLRAAWRSLGDSNPCFRRERT